MATTDRPRIIPLRSPLQPNREPDAFQATLAGVAADAARSARDRGLAAVTVSLDVAAGHAPDAEPAALVGPLRRLLEAACAAAAAPAARRGFPTLREVVVTTVDTGDALEIEVADSAPDGSLQRAAVAELRPLVERAGWGLSSTACPDGGLAVTLRIPRRRGRSLAA